MSQVKIKPLIVTLKTFAFGFVLGIMITIVMYPEVLKAL